jgi:hypothetical protein
MKSRKWIQGAIKPENKGKFKAKAEAAGKTTREFSEEKSSAPGKIGRQARLAETLMGMHKKSRNARWYGDKKD